MNPTRATGRLACILAALAAAFAATTPAALAATTPRPAPADSPPLNLPGVAGAWNKHPPLPGHVHTLATGGMPGWQITLIAAAATVLAAAIVVVLAWARASRRRAAASPA
jgi:hypothetical protein